MTLAGIPDIDRKILLNLSDDDLVIIKQVSKYFYSLYHHDDMFWFQRTKQVLPKEYTIKKDVPLTWREWYFFWKKNKGKRFLFQALNYTPLQGYLSSNYYHKNSFNDKRTIDQEIKRHLLENNKEVISSIKDRLISLFNRFFQDNYILDVYFVDFQDLIPLAFEKGYTTFALTLFGLVFYLNGKIRDKIKNCGVRSRKNNILSKISWIIREMGKRELVEDYKKYILTINRLKRYIDEMNKSFFNGYIETLCKKKLNVDEIKYILRNKLGGFILYEDYSYYNWSMIYHRFNQPSSKTYIVEKRGLRVKTSNEESFEETIQNYILAFPYTEVTILYDQITVEELLLFLNEIKSNSFLVSTHIIDLCSHQRYDLISQLDFSQSPFNSKFWKYLSRNMWFIKDKEIFTFLFKLLVKYSSIERLDILNKTLPQTNYEIILLSYRINNISRQHIDAYDFYSLLSEP